MTILKKPAWRTKDERVSILVLGSYGLGLDEFAGFTTVVNCGDILGKRAQPMTRGMKRKRKSTRDDIVSVRATISFPSDIYKTLEEIAEQKKVSLAWIVREAAERYIADKWPLFKGKI